MKYYGSNILSAVVRGLISLRLTAGEHPSPVVIVPLLIGMPVTRGRKHKW